jgi:hypothetical protein
VSLMMRWRGIMSFDGIRSFLLWCTVFNYGILMVWFLLIAVAHDWIFHMQKGSLLLF